MSYSFWTRDFFRVSVEKRTLSDEFVLVQLEAFICYRLIPRKANQLVSPVFQFGQLQISMEFVHLADHNFYYLDN